MIKENKMRKAKIGDRVMIVEGPSEYYIDRVISITASRFGQSVTLSNGQQVSNPIEYRLGIGVYFCDNAPDSKVETA